VDAIGCLLVGKASISSEYGCSFGLSVLELAASVC